MRRTAASCSATSVSGSARRTNPSAGTAALRDRRGDVQHVGPDGRAVAARGADARRGAPAAISGRSP